MQTRNNMNTTETIADRLKSARKAKGLTQFQLEDLSGVNRSNIVAIELGKIIHPSPDFIKAMASHLGVTPEFLMYGISEPDKFNIEVRAIALRLQKLPEAKRKKLLPVLNSVIDIATLS